MKRKQTSILHALVNNKMKINLKANEPDENYSESTDIVSSWGSFGVLVRMLYNKLFILKIHFHLLVLCHMKVFQNLVQQSASLFFTFSPEKTNVTLLEACYDYLKVEDYRWDPLYRMLQPYHFLFPFCLVIMHVHVVMQISASVCL